MRPASEGGRTSGPPNEGERRGEDERRRALVLLPTRDEFDSDGTRIVPPELSRSVSHDKPKLINAPRGADVADPGPFVEAGHVSFRPGQVHDAEAAGECRLEPADKVKRWLLTLVEDAQAVVKDPRRRHEREAPAATEAIDVNPCPFARIVQPPGPEKATDRVEKSEGNEHGGE
jgi:hypothetical protein